MDCRGGSRPVEPSTFFEGPQHLEKIRSSPYPGKINFFGTKYQPGEDVGIFISRVKTAATRLQEAGHKLDDLYIGFQLIRWLPQEFQSTVQQIYRWKEEDFRVVKIEAELILEANRLQLMKQNLGESGECLLEQFHFEEVEDVTWCCSSWRSKWQE
ncbi:uncharacterized protein TNCV_2070131 [Trichonephila clavipes]|uniref:Uncharacterized protein n=1 Tax=Trichonephila clavipes TaxID=2585209 RepID=A0A8X7BDF9_TRICX|nr:uncharacterized protein TNCV_2070131 [Trichonephila clavipes]